MNHTPLTLRIAMPTRNILLSIQKSPPIRHLLLRRGVENRRTLALKLIHSAVDESATTLFVQKVVQKGFLAAQDVDFASVETGAVAVAAGLLFALPAAVVAEEVFDAPEDGGLVGAVLLFFLLLLLCFFACGLWGVVRGGVAGAAGVAEVGAFRGS